MKWNADILFPKDNDYSNRITDVTHSESKSSGNMMLTIQTEVVSPTAKETVDQSGKTVEIEILAVKSQPFYAMTHIYSDGELDEEKTDKARERTEALLLSLGVQKEDVNWDELEPVIKPLLGKIILTQMESDIQEQRKTPTADQIADAKKKGTHPSQAGSIMKHPITGKQLIKYWPKIVEIYGLSQDQSQAVDAAY